MSTRSMGSGSRYTARLPKGCMLCKKGSKMVLLVSGKCRSGCFYCPLSLEKKGNDVIFANELKVGNEEDILSEARMIDAEGTGITGGDPVDALDRTIGYISLLKRELGEKHHIHLYTATMDVEAFRRLEEAGLDELRIHPPVSKWDRMEGTDIERFVRNTKMKVGFEVPSIPGEEQRLRSLIEYADRTGIDFVNLNELEFSEGNWQRLKEKGFDVKDDVSSAVTGSEETALRMVDLEVKVPVHYCSSSFKDNVQLRKRIARRAKNVALPSDLITKDGTLLKGVVDGPIEEIITLLKEKFEVQEELMHRDKEKNRLEVASWVLEEIAPELPYDAYLVEEYPTADRLEVEREPLRSKRR